MVDLSGPLHTIVSFTINDNNIIGYSHFQPQGISGIGETTGANYQATGATMLSFKSAIPKQPGERYVGQQFQDHRSGTREQFSGARDDAHHNQRQGNRGSDARQLYRELQVIRAMVESILSCYEAFGKF